jgi:hypothetical protein
MPMLPLHVGWCLPLPISSSNIVLPTQKLTSYPTLKLTTPHATRPKNATKNSQSTTTNMLPYPKTQWKTHNPHKEVVSAQGPSVGATVRIGWSFGP